MAGWCAELSKQCNVIIIAEMLLIAQCLSTKLLLLLLVAFSTRFESPLPCFKYITKVVVPNLKYTAAVQNCCYFRDLNSKLAPEVLPTLLLKNEMRKWKNSLTDVRPLPGREIGDVLSRHFAY